MKLELLQLNRPSSTILPMSSVICFPSSVFCLLYSFVKSQENNKKGRYFNGKIAKSAVTFRKNKPNFKNIKISVNSFKTSKYEILPAWPGKKQTQFKADSNPILGQYQGWQTQTNPIQTQSKAKIVNLSPRDNQLSFYPQGIIDNQLRRQTQTNLSSIVSVGEPIQTGLLLNNSRNYKYYLTLLLEAGRIPSDTEIICCNRINEKGFQTCL